MFIAIVKVVAGLSLGFIAFCMGTMWPMLAMIGDAPGSENKAMTVMAIAAGIIVAIAALSVWLLVSGAKGLL